jgi:hypothetical protein
METKNESIKNRESWLKVGVVCVLTVVVAYKFVVSPFNLTDFKFGELLALLLALFAIAMSVVFYLKASETANTFYDNTYKFTNDMSEILGRIEAGFGEKLKHLDEGYSGLLDRFDKIPFDREKAREQVEQGEEEIKKKEQERNKLIEDLAEKARLVDKQKVELFELLRTKESELDDAKKQLERAQRELDRDPNEDPKTGTRYDIFLRPVDDSAVQRLIEYLGGAAWVNKASDADIEKKFRKLWTRHDIAGFWRFVLQNKLRTDDTGGISESGLLKIRAHAKQMYSR